MNVNKKKSNKELWNHNIFNPIHDSFDISNF